MATIARRIVLVLLLVHGLVHLLGVAKAFGWAEVEELKQPISAPMGAVWLIAAILVFAAAALVWTRVASWWLVGAAGVVVSQAVIVTSWSDAEAGSFLNAALAIAVVHGFLVDHRRTSVAPRELLRTRY